MRHGFGTEKGLDVFFGWGKECITQITNVALFSCPTARKTSRNGILLRMLRLLFSVMAQGFGGALLD